MNPRAAMGDQWVSGVCLAPRPDHPQAAVDHKRDAPARARRTSPAASAAGLFAAEAKRFPEGPTGKTRRVIRGRSEGQTRGPPSSEPPTGSSGRRFAVPEDDGAGAAEERCPLTMFLLCACLCRPARQGVLPEVSGCRAASASEVSAGDSRT